jgi:hypothetical protein
MSDYQKELEDRIDRLQDHIERASSNIIITVSRFITKTPEVVDKIKIYVSYKGITDPEAGWHITSGGVNQTLAARITLADAVYYIDMHRGVEQIVDKEEVVIGYVIDKLGFGGADRIDDPVQDTRVNKNMSIVDVIQFQKVLEDAIGKNWSVPAHMLPPNQNPMQQPSSPGTTGPATPGTQRIDVPPQPWMYTPPNNRSN